MSVDPRFHEILKAVAFGDVAKVRSVGDQLSAEEHAGMSVFSTAVMSVCLANRFRDDASHAAILQFVGELRQNFANASPPLKFFTIEGVIRAFCGEEDIIDEIAAEDQIKANYPIIRKIVADSDEIRDSFDDVLQAADQLADNWTAEAEQA